MSKKEKQTEDNEPIVALNAEEIEQEALQGQAAQQDTATLTDVLAELQKITAALQKDKQ